jgi:hypothetical protein
MKTFLAVLVLAIVATSSFGVAQAGDQHWQYAYLISSPGTAPTIAYADSNGCRYETPPADSVTGDNPREHTRAYLNSVGRAVRNLGADGWEMVGNGFPYCTVNHPVEFTLHFKRRMN